jgi:hypothetical protein
MLKIPLGRRGDLATQEKMTKNLMGIGRQYLYNADEDTLLAAIEHDVGPIGIVSRGPTASDKHVVAKAVRT